MNKDKIYQEFEAKKFEIIKKLADLGLPEIEIHLYIEKLKSKRTAGFARGFDHSVHLNEDYLNEYYDELLNQTLGHEICHIYQYKYYPYAKQAHGPEWKRLMRLIGLSPDTYHSMKLDGVVRKSHKKTRYVYVDQQTGKCYNATKKQHETFRGQCKLRTGAILRWEGQIKEFY